jgi:L-ascorbate metabolism protein UlaG (beta-lactamase superfamily)
LLVTAFTSPVNRWITHLWREWIIESRRPILPAPFHPHPAKWRDDQVTLAWLGHATVLINFHGIWIITDPVLFPRIGIRVPGMFTIGPKRLTAPALTVRDLPKIDIVLLSHAHFDHFDLRTLRAIRRMRPRRTNAELEGDHRQNADATKVVTALRTGDLLRRTGFDDVTELRWGERTIFETDRGAVEITAWRVKHWGARVRRDTHRGYNSYVIESPRGGSRRILFGADTALTNSFAQLQRVDLAIMAIGAYNPWIYSHCTPEQAVQMANDAGARFVMPIHHQTFKLSAEPFGEPIERFVRALSIQPERVALTQIGETFVLR